MTYHHSSSNVNATHVHKWQFSVSTDTDYDCRVMFIKLRVMFILYLQMIGHVCNIVGPLILHRYFEIGKNINLTILVRCRY